jgi:hypothetical protein
VSWILDLGWRQYVFGIWDLGSGIREGEKSVLASGINKKCDLYLYMDSHEINLGSGSGSGVSFLLNHSVSSMVLDPDFSCLDIRPFFSIDVLNFLFFFF